MEKLKREKKKKKKKKKDREEEDDERLKYDWKAHGLPWPRTLWEGAKSHFS